jgi:hypothetical protein
LSKSGLPSVLFRQLKRKISSETGMLALLKFLD